MTFIEKIHQAGGEIFEVGGSVRDGILGRPVKDHDLLVRCIPLPELKKLLSPMGKVLEVGKAFGVLKFIPRDLGVEYDIALPRMERSTGQGHRDFDVQFNEKLPVEFDLQRRDFTINAMARNLKDGKLLDPFGGEKDLKQRRLRQVFQESFVEDPLRLLRAIQFAARFNLTIEAETFNSLREHASLIVTVSPERIIEEIGKLMRAEKPSVGFYLMRDSGLLPHLFPELQRTIGVAQPNKRSGDVFDHTMKVLDASRNCADLDAPGDLEIMFASLFHDIGKPDTLAYSPERNRITFHGHQVVSTRMARRWMKRYHINMLGVDPENILSLVYHHMFETKSFFSDKAIRRFVHKVGKDLIFKLIDLRIADKKGGAYPDKLKGVLHLKERIAGELAKKPPFGPKDLALNGYDLMDLGYPPGPIMGNILKEMVELVLDEPGQNTRESLIGWLGKQHPLSEISPKGAYAPKQNSQPQ
jgi:tRNA nucleotidyltransferase (CCA-adding enzyme)